MQPWPSDAQWQLDTGHVEPVSTTWLEPLLSHPVCQVGLGRPYGHEDLRANWMEQVPWWALRSTADISGLEKGRQGTTLFLGLTPPAGCAVWDQIWEREDLIAFASSYHDSMLGLCWCWSYVGSKLGHVGSMLGLRGALLGPRRLMFDQNWGSVGPCWGYVGAITRRAGLCWPILGLCWGYVGPAAVYVGARFAHLGAMLGLCWSMLGPCSPILGQQGPQEILQQSSQHIFPQGLKAWGLHSSRFPTRFPINSRFRVSGFKFPTRFRIGVSRFPTGFPIGSQCRVLGLRFPTKFRYRALELRLLTGSR